MKSFVKEQRFVKNLLKMMGEDPNREGLKETPRRVVKAMLEMTKGYKDDPYQYAKLKVYSEATHGCMGCRGVNQRHCNTKVVIEESFNDR